MVWHCLHKERARIGLLLKENLSCVEYLPLTELITCCDCWWAHLKSDQNL